jgi:serine/threonine protein kinase
VNIGDLFHQRYRVIGKLGYGTASTVWLCHDVLQSQKQYVALKVWVNGGKPLRELSIYQHINSLDSQHDGRDHIRKLVDSFVISGPHGEHTCLVHEALGMNLEDLQDLIGVFPADLLRQGLREILRGMQFLHQEAEVVHTGRFTHTSSSYQC